MGKLKTAAQLNVIISLCIYISLPCSLSALVDRGLPSQAFEYIRYNGGIESESDYPYFGKDEWCNFNPYKVVATVNNVHNFTQVSGTDFHFRMAIDILGVRGQEGKFIPNNLYCAIYSRNHVTSFPFVRYRCVL